MQAVLLPQSSSSGGTGTRYVCRDTEASNYKRFGKHDERLCKYDTEEEEETEAPDLDSIEVEAKGKKEEEGDGEEGAVAE